MDIVTLGTNGGLSDFPHRPDKDKIELQSRLIKVEVSMADRSCKQILGHS